LKYPFDSEEIYFMNSFIVVLTTLMVLSSGFAFAKEEMEMDAGIKMWYAGYKTVDTLNNSSMTFDPVLLVGPAFEVELPSNLFFEASYLMTVADYEKNQGTGKLSSDTKFLDAAIGYYFTPEVGIFAGYKNESTNWKNTDIGTNESGSTDVSGPLIGIRGSYSFDNMLGVYVSATYLKTKAENKEPSGTMKEDAPGTEYELGVKAKFSKALTGSLGYKIESSEGDKSKVKDTYSGVTLDVMYAF
jgi:hypothetical protein